MHAEIFLAIMVLAVVLLVAADFFRRQRGRRTSTPGNRRLTPGGRPSLSTAPSTAFPWARPREPPSSPPVPARPAPGRPPASGRRGGITSGSTAPEKSWLVRTRLSLLAVAPAIAAASATASAIRAADTFRRPSSIPASARSATGPLRRPSLAWVFAVIVLAVGVAPRSS